MRLVLNADGEGLRGQTAIEYLMLVVTSVLLVSIVAYFIKTRVL